MPDIWDSVESVVRKAVSASPKDDGAGKPFFRKEGYKAFDITSDNFREIPIYEESSKIAFIDGSNASLIDSPALGIQFIRVYFSVFSGNEKICFESSEFYTVCGIDASGSEIIYSCEPVAPSGQAVPKPFSISSSDRSIISGPRRARISRMGEVARVFAEWMCAERACSVVGKGGVVVMDGSLQCEYPGQGEYAERVFSSAEKSSSLLCGLSKTSYLCTTTGKSLLSVINMIGEKIAEGKAWQYNPVVEISDSSHQADISIVKLRPGSKAFRFEIWDRQKESTQKALSALRQNSNDICFPGYPYGLIDAHRFARIRTDEADSRRRLVEAALKNHGKWDDTMSDPHDMLDRL